MDEPTDAPAPRRRQPWTLYLWLVALAGLALAAAPIAIASVGLLLHDRDLQTYHWLTLVTAPVGLPVAVVAGLAALVRTVLRAGSAR